MARVLEKVRIMRGPAAVTTQQTISRRRWVAQGSRQFNVSKGLRESDLKLGRENLIMGPIHFLSSLPSSTAAAELIAAEMARIANQKEWG